MAAKIKRMTLAFQYHNARILINRPCLFRLGYHIPNESNRSRGFDRSAAATCVGGARETVALLPDNSDPRGLIAMSPWWCLLHYLVSAGAVLMMEIAMRAEHNPKQAEGLLNDAKKIVRWLRAMSKDNLAAERSWAILSKLLLISAPRIGGDTTDVERDLDDSNAAKLRARLRSEKLPQPSGIAEPQMPSFGNGTSNEGGGGGGGGGIGMQSMDDGGEAVTGGQDPGSIVFSPVEALGGAQEIFRGLIADPFPFGNIPIHSPFDNLTDTGPFSTHPSGLSRFTSLYHDDPMEYSHEPSPLPPSPLFPPAIQIGEVGLDQADERLQRRLSRGVSNICMPPLPKFPQWSAVDRFGMNHVAYPGPYEDYFRFGRADLHRATPFASDGAADVGMPDYNYHQHHHRHPQSGTNRAAATTTLSQTASPKRLRKPVTEDGSSGHRLHGGSGDSHGNTNNIHRSDLYME